MSVNDPMMESKHHDPMLDCITCRDWDGFPAADGEVVEFSDLPALLAAAREDERKHHLRDAEQYGYEQGQRDERGKTSAPEEAYSYPPTPVSPTSVAPAGEDYGAPHDDPCDCDDCREAVAAQGEHDPRIVHVASELDVDLGPQAENEGNVEFVTDVIAAVDYANEQCGLTYEQGRADERHRLICGEDVMPSDCACLAEGYAKGRADERETFDQQALFADAKAWGYAAGLDAATQAVADRLVASDWDHGSNGDGIHLALAAIAALKAES